MIPKINTELNAVPFGGSDCSANLKYHTIVADPPWPYESAIKGSLAHRPNRDKTDASRMGISSVERYGCMSIAELCSMPVSEKASDNAHLYLWTTNGFMVEAHTIARAWGFEPKTIITWVKVRQEDGKPSMKMGHYYRGATEHCLFCVRGSLRLQGNPHATVFLTTRPQRGHSSKPDYFYAMVEKQSLAPRLEIFARPQDPLWPKRDGWQTWGNELPNDVELVTPNAPITDHSPMTTKTNE